MGNNLEIKTLKMKDIHPYKRNPRKNDQAVDAVMESIKQCGYCAPIVVDENHEVLAGHTRLKAIKKLGWDECEVVIKEGLTEEQKRKYRLLDNKTNELAEWDMELLEIELDGLDFEGFEFGLDTPQDDAMPTNLDDDGEKTNVVVSINFPDVDIYDSVKDEIQKIADEHGATIAVKMA